MESLISRETAEKQKKRAKRYTVLFRLLAGGTLALFVVLCLLTRTANARLMFWMMLASMTLLGWIGILLYIGRVRPSRAEAGHLDMLFSEEPEEYEGIFHLEDGVIRIPHSVQVRKVTLRDGENTRRLNLDAGFADRMPADGARVRVQAVKQYITGLEILSSGTEEPRTADSRLSVGFRRFRHGLSVFLPLFVLWAMLVAILGGFVMNQITDTAPRNKIVIFADCEVSRAAELAAALEQSLSDPVRMVKVHPFDYVLYGNGDTRNADMYIVAASDASRYREWFAPLPEELAEAEPGVLLLDEVPYGIPVHVPREGIRVAEDYFRYDPGTDYYLFFGKTSLHLSGLDGAVDNQAVDAAKVLIHQY